MFVGRLAGSLARRGVTALVIGLLPSLCGAAASGAGPTRSAAPPERAGTVPRLAPTSTPPLRLAPMLPRRVKADLAFEPNRGQVDSRVRYLSRGPRHTIALCDDGMTVSLQQRGAPEKPLGAATYRSTAVRFRLAGARHQPLRGERAYPGKAHWVRGSDRSRWQLNMPRYRSVVGRAVYPGIDLRYYGRSGSLEYDFIVAPGADPDDVRIGIEGGAGVRLDPGGELVIATALGELRQSRPVLYQVIDGRKRQVAGGYRMPADRKLAFRVGKYRKDLPLVIDPVLTYAFLIGGPENDLGQSVAVDAGGRVYVAGTTRSPNLFAPDTPVQGEDIFVVKYDPSGAHQLFATTISGSGADVLGAIALDASGDVVLTGSTTSANYPRVPMVAPEYSGTQDAVVTRLDGTGIPTFSRLFGGSLQEAGTAVAVDSADGIYLAGVTESSNFFTSNAAQSMHGGGGIDAFAARLNAAGDVLFSTYLGGTGRDSAAGIAVTAVGIAVAGSTSGGYPTTPGQAAFQGGGLDGFVTLLNAGGSLATYARYLGGSGEDQVRALAADGDGRLYVAGVTTSAGLAATGAFQSALAGNYDAFVARLAASNLELERFTYLGGIGADGANAIAVDLSGNILVAGVTHSNSFPVMHGFHSYQGAGDAFVTRLNADATAADYSTFLGGSQYDEALGLAVDAGGSAYVTGVTRSLSFAAGGAAIENGRGADAFLVKFPPLRPAPAAPTDLALTEATPGRVVLGWTDNSTDESSFQVERAEGSGPYANLASTGAGGMSFTDSDVTPETVLRYRVRAVGPGGNSAPSNELLVFVPEVPAPTDLVVGSISQTSIMLTWTSPATGELTFDIERSNGSDTKVTVSRPGNLTTYTDTGLTPNTQYTYRVLANTLDGKSTWSAPRSATTGSLAVPTLLHITNVTESSITLQWDGVDGAVSTEIERTQPSAAEGNGAASFIIPLAQEVLVDTGLAADTVYVYRVRSVSTAGNSDWSSGVSGRTAALSPATGLTAEPVRGMGINLAWAHVGEPVVGFRVKRGGATGELTEIASLSATEREYLDARALAGQTYRYAVVARYSTADAASSNEVQVAVPAVPAPVLLRVVVPASGTLRAMLNWSYAPDPVLFRVERSADGLTGWEILDSVQSTRRDYEDGTVLRNHTYFYRVLAVSPSGNSEPSNSISLSVPPAPLDGITVKPTLLVIQTQLRRKKDDKGVVTVKAVPKSKSVKIINESGGRVTVTATLHVNGEQDEFAIATGTGERIIEHKRSANVTVTLSGKYRGIHHAVLSLKVTAADGQTAVIIDVPVRGRTDPPRGGHQDPFAQQPPMQSASRHISSIRPSVTAIGPDSRAGEGRF